MIKIGEYQELKIAREMPQGYYLENEEGEEVLLPKRYITEEMNLEDTIKVFVYCDSEDWEVATTEKPLVTVDEFALLEVIEVSSMGAFCEWGMAKDLLVPFRNQSKRLKKGDKAMVYMYLDELSDRLVGSTKLNKFLFLEADEDIKSGEKVDVVISEKTDLGYKVIINNNYLGLVYHSEIKEPLEIGAEMVAYVKPIRADGKLDISIDPIGIRSIDINSQKLLDALKAANGFLPFTDKSNPDDIRKEFGVSKKLFKKSIGGLYRQKIISLGKDGIRLND